jgi:steroid 5-alpha reductase family enzyme
MNARMSARIQIILAYSIAAALGLLLYWVTPGALWLRVGAADLAMTLFIYGVSVGKRNSSVYDPYWSVIPLYFLVGFACLFPVADWGWMQGGTAVVVTLWSVRLTWNWTRSWPGFHHEDWRYVNFRNQFGRAFEWVNFSGIHLFPTCIVFLGCLPMFWVFEPVASRPVFAAVGLGAGLLGVGLQFFADNQLVRFRRRANPDPQEVLQSGLWGVIRHPNYLGEMLFWWAVCFFGLGNGAPWYTVAGAVAMMCMFWFASIPMKETRMAQRRPAFAAYQERVPLLIPWFPRR